MIAAFDDMSLVQLIVERGPDAVGALPKGIRESNESSQRSSAHASLSLKGVAKQAVLLR